MCCCNPFLNTQTHPGITYPFPNFNGETVEVWEWISSFIPRTLILSRRSPLRAHMRQKTYNINTAPTVAVTGRLSAMLAKFAQTVLKSIILGAAIMLPPWEVLCGLTVTRQRREPRSVLLGSWQPIWTMSEQRKDWTSFIWNQHFVYLDFRHIPKSSCFCQKHSEDAHLRHA